MFLLLELVNLCSVIPVMNCSLCEAADVLGCFCRVIKGCPLELAVLSTFECLHTYNSRHSIKHQGFAVL